MKYSIRYRDHNPGPFTKHLGTILENPMSSANAYYVAYLSIFFYSIYFLLSPQTIPCQNHSIVSSTLHAQAILKFCLRLISQHNQIAETN